MFKSGEKSKNKVETQNFIFSYNKSTEVYLEELINKENVNLINALSPQLNKYDINRVNKSSALCKRKRIITSRDKYDKLFFKDRSPFLLTNKINFRKEFNFKYTKKKNDLKIKHLGLCDFYNKGLCSETNEKENKNELIDLQEKESETQKKIGVDKRKLSNESSTTPKFVNERCNQVIFP